MKTAQEIAQWVIDNRYPKSENEKVSDFEMYHHIVDMINGSNSQPDILEDEEDDDEYGCWEEENDFRIFDCTCGAWVWSQKLAKYQHIADCICGSSEPF